MIPWILPGIFTVFSRHIIYIKPLWCDVILPLSVDKDDEILKVYGEWCKFADSSHKHAPVSRFQAGSKHIVYKKTSFRT
jgi:hypothetical protein